MNATVLNSLLTDLAACVYAKVEGDTLCFVGVLSGEGIALEYGDCEGGKCGMAWVRIAGMYPATGVGVPLDIYRPCPVLTGLTIEVGVARCYPVHFDGRPPTVEEQAEVATTVGSDSAALQAAIQCCDRLDEHGYRLSLWAPIGPQGGMVGGYWTFETAI